MLNIAKLKTEVKKTAADIKALKKEMRQPNYNASWSEYAALKQSKKEATLLCTILAHSRKHIHRKEMTLEEQAEFLGDKLEEFTISAEPVAA